MARATIKSQQIIIDQLSAQVAELTTQLGILMSQLEASNQARAALQDERDTLAMASEVPDAIQESYAVLVDERNELIAENQRLTESCIAAHKRCDALEAIVAAQPKTALPASPKKPALKPSVLVSAIEAQPVVQITDADKRIWAAFQALPREKRQSYYEFARATVGHLGIHNIIAVREAYLAQQSA